MAGRPENQDKERTPRAAAKSPAGRAAAKTPAGRAAAKSATVTRSASKGSSPPSGAARGARSVEEKPATKDVKTEDKVAVPAGQPVNREMKRMMARREGAADRLKRPTVPRAKRTKPLAFLKEVRGELGKVAWPTRQEVMTYSVVVLITVIFFMVVIYGIDYVALKGVLLLIERGGR
ncbi:MAG: preprotein translocase subunit SecE [Actinomycetota bacterium]